MNKFIKIVFALGTLAILVAGLFVGLAYLFEDEIVKGVQLKINQQLDTKVAVEEVSFSMLERFPYASIRFSDVWIEDKNVPGDTLLFSKEVYLSFNMMDLVSKNYTIKKAEINDGLIRMHRNAEGSSNYFFWHTSDDKSATVNFDIEELKLREMEYRYLLGDHKFELTSYVENLDLSGSINEDGLALQNRIVMDLHHLQYEGMTYIENQHTKLQGGISLDNTYEDLQFNDFTLGFGAVEIPIQGSIFKNAKNWNVDLETHHAADLQEILTVLSQEVRDEFSTYNLSGKLAYDAKLKGAITDETIPLLRVNFLLEKGRVMEKASGVSMDNIYFKGAYQSLQGGSERLEIEDMKAQLAGGILDIDGAVENFDNPWLNLNLLADVNVYDLEQFLQVESIDKMKGHLDINAKFKGPFPNKDITRESLDRLKMSGDMRVADLNLQLKGSHQQFHELNGQVQFDDNDLRIVSLTGHVNGSPFDASGNLTGFMHYVLGKQDKLNVVAKIHSPHLNLDAMLGEEDGAVNFSLHNNLNFNLAADIQQLTYKNFEAQNIHGQVIIKEGSIEVENVKFNTAKGSIDGLISVQQQGKDNFAIRSSVNMTDIDIAEIFDQFDQFGQEFIQSKHLKGTGRAKVSYHSTMSNALQIEPKSIQCDADIVIENGELINHPAMRDIYLALNDNKVVKPFVRLAELKGELDHLKFSKLSNRIHIKDGDILIPEMTIASNAMDINISGEHSFDNEIDYQFNFKLSEILIRKTQSEFGPIADDGTGAKLFMRMYGSADDPSFSLDKQKMKENRQKDFIAEKATLKKIIKEDLFRKGDNSQSKKDDPSEKTIITIEEGITLEKPKDDTKKVVVQQTQEEEDDESDDDDDF